jgi:dimethylargininase
LIDPLPVPKIVVVRRVSAAYASCLRTRFEPIDVDLARHQHQSYVDAIRNLGVRVDVLSPLDSLADSVFVEDAAVVLDRRVVISRPGAESRRDEAVAIADPLSQHVSEVEIMAAPATLDGGDVLRAGALVFVGRSGRTNDEGIAFLAAAAEKDGLETVAISVEGGLHLKSACAPIGARTIVYHAPHLDPRLFEARGIRCVAVPEPEGANVLALGRTILVSSAAPRTETMLAALGYEVVRVDVSEFHKGDGALTCLSIRI